MSTSPIKRNEALKPFSRDHHHGLLLCWKIREGLKRNVDVNRMKRYVDWFWNTHLQQHFEEEEKYIFSILSVKNRLVVRAKNEHYLLRIIFVGTLNTYASLELIQEHLQAHIRFEERILFNKIQQIATSEQLQNIAIHHHDTFSDDWEDEFWKG